MSLRPAWTTQWIRSPPRPYSRFHQKHTHTHKKQKQKYMGERYCVANHPIHKSLSWPNKSLLVSELRNYCLQDLRAIEFQTNSSGQFVPIGNEKFILSREKPTQGAFPIPMPKSGGAACDKSCADVLFKKWEHKGHWFRILEQ